MSNNRLFGKKKKKQQCVVPLTSVALPRAQVLVFQGAEMETTAWSISP
jgi:hypothetical protein